MPHRCVFADKKYFEALSAFLEDEFSGKVTITGIAGQCGTGAFEVRVAGQLIHSKLTMGHGRCESDAELDAIVANISQRLS